MNPYITSLRLRTLPLSMSGIILGSGIAFRANESAVSARQWGIFLLALCTTVCLQILSNLSNELGDALKGTDEAQHGRKAYGLQTGAITPKQMKGMIGLFIGLSIVFGTALVLTSFLTPDTGFHIAYSDILVFLGLGAIAIIGAMTYTLGKHSYGYMGLGDLGVLLFFGLLSTIGGYYLQTRTLNWEIVLCGIAIGLPCVGVLNLNNIRDMDNDRLHGKRTFASLLGKVGARWYQTLLLIGCLAIFVSLGYNRTLLISPLWIWHLWFVWTHKEGLDKQMPVLMITTFITAFLALIG